MSGLFDYSDPEIALAAGLLSGRGNLGGIMGRSLMDAQRAYLATSEDKRRNKLAELQASQVQIELDKAAQQKKQQALLDQFRASIPAPTALGNVDWKSGQMGPTNDRVSQVGQIDPLQLLMHGAMKSGALSPIDYIKAQQKDDALTTVPAGATVLKGGKPIFSNPKEDAVDPFVRLLKQAGIDPASPQGQALLTQRLQKEASHQEPISVNNYGPVQEIDLGNGKKGLLQPPTRPGGPSALVNLPGTNTPATRPADGAGKDPTEFQSKAKLYYQSMDSATKVLTRLEDSGRTDWKMTAQEVVVGNEDVKTTLMSPARQKYVQAQRQWIDSINRVRSGANLPDLEYHRAVRTFFPTIGEGRDLVEQKRQQRAQEEAAMRDAAGRAMKDKPAAAPASNVMRFDAQGNPIK
jgi:hypothetical protein